MLTVLKNQKTSINYRKTLNSYSTMQRKKMFIFWYYRLFEKIYSIHIFDNPN